MLRITRQLPVLPVLAVASLAACTDLDRVVAPTSEASTISADDLTPDLNKFRAFRFDRYVAIGTSVSAGVQSDGLIASTQETSWPVQLAKRFEQTITLPYIDGTGCRSPLVAPLASGVRISGEGAGADAATLSCAPNKAGVTLPTRNVALNGATTRDALLSTPESFTDGGHANYSRVLGPGQTQVSAMMAQHPEIVSVELGASDVLGARSGIAIEGATVVPYSVWAAAYDAILDSVEKVAHRGVVVGLIDDVASFPGFRRGDELWADRLAFLGAFNVEVSADCAGSTNLLFVPVRVPVAVANGVGRAQAGLGPYTLSCAAAGPAVQDYVLDSAEAAHVNSLMHQMTRHIQHESRRRGFAYFALESLYGREGLKAPFSVVALMTSTSPYGSLISLDGVHPTAGGQAILAKAAYDAIDRTYVRGRPGHVALAPHGRGPRHRGWW